MTLEESKAIMAASLLSGSVKHGHSMQRVQVPTQMEIEAAVKTSEEIWLEVLRQGS